MKLSENSIVLIAYLKKTTFSATSFPIPLKPILHFTPHLISSQFAPLHKTIRQSVSTFSVSVAFFFLQILPTARRTNCKERPDLPAEPKSKECMFREFGYIWLSMWKLDFLIFNYLTKFRWTFTGTAKDTPLTQSHMLSSFQILVWTT